MAKRMEQVDVVLDALAHPARRCMVTQLGCGPATVSDLSVPLGIAMPTVVRHLSVLERAGLLTSEKIGRQRVCTLNRATLRVVDDWLDAQRHNWETRADRLVAFLDAGNDDA